MLRGAMAVRHSNDDNIRAFDFRKVVLFRSYPFKVYELIGFRIR